MIFPADIPCSCTVYVLSVKNPFGPDGKYSPPLTVVPPKTPSNIFSVRSGFLYGIICTFAIFSNMNCKSFVVRLYRPDCPL